MKKTNETEIKMHEAEKERVEKTASIVFICAIILFVLSLFPIFGGIIIFICYLIIALLIMLVFSSLLANNWFQDFTAGGKEFIADLVNQFLPMVPYLMLGCVLVFLLSIILFSKTQNKAKKKRTVAIILGSISLAIGLIVNFFIL